MKKTLFTMMTAGLMAAASAQDQGAKPEAGAKIGGDTAAAAAESAVKAKDLNALLKGQLIKIDGDKAKSAELEKGMEYYLVYHSASW